LNISLEKLGFGTIINNIEERLKAAKIIVLEAKGSKQS